MVVHWRWLALVVGLEGSSCLFGCICRTRLLFSHSSFSVLFSVRQLAGFSWWCEFPVVAVELLLLLGEQFFCFQNDFSFFVDGVDIVSATHVRVII